MSTYFNCSKCGRLDAWQEHRSDCPLNTAREVERALMNDADDELGGGSLDQIADTMFGLSRLPGETDCALRSRLKDAQEYRP